MSIANFQAKHVVQLTMMCGHFLYMYSVFILIDAVFEKIPYCYIY